jgi:hypothetical protein
MVYDDKPITWLCDLYELNTATAKFVAGATGCRLELPALEWVGMGRPGQVQITPTPFRWDATEGGCTCPDPEIASRSGHVRSCRQAA